MNHKLYKNLIMLFAIGFLGNLFAQKFDKKIVENFNVHKDVEVVINASNAEINVTNWGKNEVQVEAFIEIEGLTKEEAEKYFKNWNFEALGNSSKVKITSQGNNSSDLRNDFIIHNNIDFTIPDFQIPDFDSIVLPEMNFDFNFDFKNLVNNLDNLVKNAKYSFKYFEDDNHIVIKTKKEWDAFKKTEKYEELKNKMSIDKEELKKSLVESKEQLKRDLEKAKLEFQKIDKEEIKKQLAEAKKQIMEMRSSFNSNSNDMTINGKKINIKKRLEIKVPENATFNLNTRHCKVKLPNTKAFGKVSYGDFNAGGLNGGKLTIDYSKVTINDLNGCNLFLNNVTDAKIASVTNTTMHTNSSGVKIKKINENVYLSDKFGELTVNSFIPNFQKFVLNLSYSNATIVLGDVKTSYVYNLEKSKLDNKTSFGLLNKVIKTNEISSKSILSNEKTKNKFELNSEYSTIIIK